MSFDPAQIHSFNLALARFVRMLTAAKNTYYARNYPAAYASEHGVTFEVQFGKRNVRIVERRAVDGRSGSVYCFVEIGSGKIMKPGGFKAPEPKRHARGNIFAVKPLDGCGPHGVMYLTGGGNYEFRPEDLEAAEAAREGKE